jgi:hypothetical protein
MSVIIYRDFNCPPLLPGQPVPRDLGRGAAHQQCLRGAADDHRYHVAGLSFPQSPDLPGTLDRVTNLTRIVRRSGGTIVPDGGPLATRVS